jgi:hypothetical protein
MRELERKIDSQQAEISDIKQTLDNHQQKIDFFVRTNQPPVEGVLFEEYHRCIELKEYNSRFQVTSQGVCPPVISPCDTNYYLSKL